MMKKVGFQNHHAGAIEAISSTGGQIMPPIMGAGVFILATLTETDYLTIAGMNVIPAILFFVFIMLMVDLEAVKGGLKGLPIKDVPDFKKVIKRMALFYTFNFSDHFIVQWFFSRLRCFLGNYFNASLVLEKQRNCHGTQRYFYWFN